MVGEHGDNFAHKETVISDESSSEGAGDVTLPEKINEYSIKQRIGMGAMGVVYQAQQPGTRRDVAIKVMHPSMASPRALRRFEHEAQLLAKLQHPGIAQIFEAGTWDALVSGGRDGEIRRGDRDREVRSRSRQSQARGSRWLSRA